MPVSLNFMITEYVSAFNSSSVIFSALPAVKVMYVMLFANFRAYVPVTSALTVTVAISGYIAFVALIVNAGVAFVTLNAADAVFCL